MADTTVTTYLLTYSLTRYIARERRSSSPNPAAAAAGCLYETKHDEAFLFVGV